MRFVKLVFFLILLTGLVFANLSVNVELSDSSIVEGSSTTLTATVSGSDSDVKLILSSAALGKELSSDPVSENGSSTQYIGDLQTPTSKSWTITGNTAGNYDLSITAQGSNYSSSSNISLTVNTPANVSLKNLSCNNNDNNIDEGDSYIVSYDLQNSGGTSATINNSVETNTNFSNGGGDQTISLSAGQTKTVVFNFTANSVSETSTGTIKINVNGANINTSVSCSSITINDTDSTQTNNSNDNSNSSNDSDNGNDSGNNSSNSSNTNNYLPDLMAKSIYVSAVDENKKENVKLMDNEYYILKGTKTDLRFTIKNVGDISASAKYTLYQKLTKNNKKVFEKSKTYDDLLKKNYQTTFVVENYVFNEVGDYVLEGTVVYSSSEKSTSNNKFTKKIHVVDTFTEEKGNIKKEIGEYTVDYNADLNVGEKAKVLIKDKNNLPLKNYDVNVILPSGKIVTLKTDENGFVLFDLNTEGSYYVVAKLPDGSDLNVKIESIGSSSEAKAIAIKQTKSKNWYYIAGLVVLLVLLVGFFVFFKLKKKEVKGLEKLK